MKLFEIPEDSTPVRYIYIYIIYIWYLHCIPIIYTLYTYLFFNIHMWYHMCTHFWTPNLKRSFPLNLMFAWNFGPRIRPCPSPIVLGNLVGRNFTWVIGDTVVSRKAQAQVMCCAICWSLKYAFLSFIFIAASCLNIDPAFFHVALILISPWTAKQRE